MAAAPHLFDDLLNASPELALVDLDLAAQLRADIRSGAEFRPRQVARPEFRLLLPDTVSADAEPEPTPVLDGEPTAPADVVVAPAEIVVEPVLVELAPAPLAIATTAELPDYIVPRDEPGADESVLQDEAARDAYEPTAISYPTYLGVASEPTTLDEASQLPDYIVQADVPVSAREETPTSDYPELPDLGEATEALEETEAALRKIREQLVSDEPARGRRRLRRGFTVMTGLGAVAALALFAVDVQLGVATLPGWLGF